MTKLSDTSAEAQRVLLEAYRRLTPGQKWLRLGEMYRLARALHAAGVRHRNPAATPQEIHEAWMVNNLGFRQKELIQEPVVDPEALRELRKVLKVFITLGIPYALGGSMASSVYGIDRYTRDADITVEPFQGLEAQLVDHLGPDFYVSPLAIEEAIRNRSSFNIINTRTGFKVDVFVRKEREFERMAMARRTAMELPDLPGQPLVLQTAEDVTLFKLAWYRLGGEASEQQWKDILGVLQMQAGKLDETYLDRWAAELRLNDLLARARKEAAEPTA